MTPTQIKEAYTLMGERDTLKSRIEKIRAWGTTVNVYLGSPEVYVNSRDAYGYHTPARYVTNFPVSSQIIVEGLERELTDITNKLKGLGVTD